MTIAKILDRVLPYTKEELTCGLKKQVKMQQRALLTQLINEWYNEKQQAIKGTVDPAAGRC